MPTVKCETSAGTRQWSQKMQPADVSETTAMRTAVRAAALAAIPNSSIHNDEPSKTEIARAGAMVAAALRVLADDAVSNGARDVALILRSYAREAAQ